jgi:hypothetical protein
MVGWDVCQAGRVFFLPIAAYTALPFFPLCFLRTCDMRHAQVQKADGIDYICIYSFTTLCPIRDKEYRCCTDPASLDQRTNGDLAISRIRTLRPSQNPKQTVFSGSDEIAREHGRTMSTKDLHDLPNHCFYSIVPWKDVAGPATLRHHIPCTKNLHGSASGP